MIPNCVIDWQATASMIGAAAAIVTAGVVIWYTVETSLLRKATQEQVALAHEAKGAGYRPFLRFSVETGYFEVANVGLGAATEIQLDPVRGPFLAYEAMPDAVLEFKRISFVDVGPKNARRVGAFLRFTDREGSVTTREIEVKSIVDKLGSTGDLRFAARYYDLAIQRLGATYSMVSTSNDAEPLRGPDAKRLT